MSKNANRRTGRPAGRRNTPRETVLCLPPSCPTCGQTIRVNLAKKPTHTLDGPVQVAGQSWAKFEYRYVTCTCGQGLSVGTPRP